MRAALNVAAVFRGSLIALVIAVPAAAVLSGAGDDPSNWVYLAFLAVIVAYLAGGAVAGRRAPDRPFLHGAAAASGAFVVVQAVSLLVRLIGGDGVSVVALVFNLLLAASIGVVGSGIGTLRGTLEPGGGEPTG